MTLSLAEDSFNTLQFSEHHEFRPGPEGLGFVAVPPSVSLSDIFTSPTLKSRQTTVHRPRSLTVLHRARLRSLHFGESEKVDWDSTEVQGPDVEDKHTLAQLARMSGNAYAMPGQKSWYDVDQAWNTVCSRTYLYILVYSYLLAVIQSFPFGWEDADDGFRGHVFLSSDNSTIVLSIKGTTLQGPTSKKDKFNDNLCVALLRIPACANIATMIAYSLVAVLESISPGYSGPSATVTLTVGGVTTLAYPTHSFKTACSTILAS